MTPLTIPGMELGPGVLSLDGSLAAVLAASDRHPKRGVVELRSAGRWHRLGRPTGSRRRPLAFSPDGSQLRCSGNIVRGDRTCRLARILARTGR
jgi:hypothetical protein